MKAYGIKRHINALEDTDSRSFTGTRAKKNRRKLSKIIKRASRASAKQSLKSQYQGE